MRFGDSYSGPPYGLLVGGAVFLVLAVAGVCTGKLWGRGGVTYRAEEPKSFWSGVAVCCLVGVFLILDYFAHVN